MEREPLKFREFFMFDRNGPSATVVEIRGAKEPREARGEVTEATDVKSGQLGASAMGDFPNV